MNTPAPAPGKLIVLSGPSGSGKTTIVQRLLAAVPELVRSISATTRPPRPGEQDGKDYFFLSRGEFDRRAAEGAFLEHAEVFGNGYGTPRDFVERETRAGRSVVLAIDVQGADIVRRKFSPVVSIFVLPPNLPELERRLRERKSDAEADVARRLATARAEIGRKDQYDFVVVNDDVDAAVQAVVRHIKMALHTKGRSLLE